MLVFLIRLTWKMISLKKKELFKIFNKRLILESLHFEYVKKKCLKAYYIKDMYMWIFKYKLTVKSDYLVVLILYNV